MGSIGSFNKNSLSMSVYDFHCFGDLFGQCEKGTKMILQHAVLPVAVFEFSDVVFRLLAS